MASITSCLLCSFTCCEYKCLYNGDGEANEFYHITAKYFDSTLSNAETKPILRAICIECWQHISDFHSFQQRILNAQLQLNNTQFIAHEEKLKLEKTEQMSFVTADVNSDNITTSSIISNDPVLTSLEFQNDKADDDGLSVVNEQFECAKCENIFQSYVALNKHFQQVHNIKCSDNSFNRILDTVEKDFDNRTSTKAHNKKGENIFKCETCAASFSQYGNLRRHIRKNHNVQPLLKLMCKYCNKMFKYISHLQKHKNKFHNHHFRYNSKSITEDKVDKNYIIGYKIDYAKESESSNMFNETNSVDMKSTTAKIEQNVKQASCDAEFSTIEVSENRNGELESLTTEINSNMQIHMPALDIVDIKNEIPTDVESDEGTTKMENNSNINELNAEEYYDEFLERWKGNLECPKCSQHVKNYFQLRDHFILTHPDERCYINCCHIKLYGRRSIVGHLQFHENTNTVRCAECGKCFKNRKALGSHKWQVHSDSKSTYQLHLCYCERSQGRHAENMAGGQEMEYDTLVCCQRKKKILEDDALIAKWKKELSCEICKANFSYYSLMRTHFYRDHPGETFRIFCCQRKMSRISDAIDHIRFHLDPHTYRCKICNIDFSAKNTLARHIRNTHIDSLPKHRWACDECDKTFKLRHSLTRHKNVIHSIKGSK